MPLTTTNFLKEQIIADKNSAKCENKQSFVYPNELSWLKIITITLENTLGSG